MSARALRVGIDARELLGRPTGVGRYLAELLARWTRDPALAAHHLVLYAPSAPSLPWLGETGATVESRVLTGRQGTAWEQFTLGAAANDDDLTVFFAPAYGAPLWVRAPVVVAMHDVSFAAQPQWFRWREGLRRRWLAALTARRAAAVLTLTAWSADQIADHLGVPASRLRVIAPAVDRHPALGGVPPAGPADDTSREPLVLYAGSIFNRRNLPALVRGFARLVRTVPEARLAIVGENRTYPRQDLAEVVATFGLRRHVTLYDYADEATLAGLYARARVFAFLSAYEGFGLTPLEAMARGVPAVLLDTPVARESCADAADYVGDPDDHHAVAAALGRLLVDEAYHAARAHAGRARAAAFSWDRTARQTFDALRAAAGD